MRLASVLREAGINLISGTTRAVAFALALALGVSILAGVDIEAVATLERRSEQFQLSGGSTLIYAMNGQINGAACDALAAMGGVRAAGAVRREQQAVRSGTLPGDEIPTFSVSPQFGGFRALGSPLANGGVMLSSDLANTLGVGLGDAIELVSGVSRIGSIYTYDDDGRRPGLGYAVLTPSDTTSPFDECWAETWPTSKNVASLLSTTLEPGAVTAGIGGPTPELRQLNSRLGVRFDGADDFQDRVTRFAPEAAAVLALALGFIAVRLRRLEFASALHARIPRSTQALQILLETSAWTAAAGLVAVLIVLVVIHVLHPIDAPSLVGIGIRVLASAPATVLGALISLALIREKNLFTYFNER